LWAQTGLQETITTSFQADGTMKAYRIGNANMIDRAYLADWLEKRALTKV
jgi:hypothetical protein